jgi:hypothetical protein
MINFVNEKGHVEKIFKEESKVCISKRSKIQSLALYWQ